ISSPQAIAPNGQAQSTNKRIFFMVFRISLDFPARPLLQPIRCKVVGEGRPGKRNARCGVTSVSGTIGDRRGCDARVDRRSTTKRECSYEWTNGRPEVASNGERLLARPKLMPALINRRRKRYQKKPTTHPAPRSNRYWGSLRMSCGLPRNRYTPAP